MQALHSLRGLFCFEYAEIIEKKSMISILQIMFLNLIGQNDLF